MRWVREAFVTIASATCVGISHENSAQVIEVIAALRSNHVADGPLLWGWDFEMGFTNTSNILAWGNARYSGIEGGITYHDEHYMLRDQARSVGIKGGIGWRSGMRCELRAGIHVDYVIQQRNLIGDPSSWIGSYRAEGLGCGLSGLVRYPLAKAIALTVEIAPGYFTVLNQNTVTEPLIEKQIRNGPYIGFTIGLALQLNAL